MLPISVAVFAVSMYLTSVLRNQTGFWDLFVPQWARGMGLMFFYMSANMIALGTVPQDRMKNAAVSII